MPLSSLVHGRLNSVFYGWWIVLAGVGLNMLNAGLLAQTFGAYVVVGNYPMPV